MAFSINTNTAALAALQSLRETNADLTATQNAVSTGKKVDSAADDPAVYVIAQKMNSQISGLSAVSNGLSIGTQVVSTATSALDSIGSVLTQIQSLVSQGQSQSIDPSTINSQITNLLSNIDSYAENATFSGVNLISGSTNSTVSSNQLNIVTNADASSTLIVGSSNTASTSALNATSAGLGLAGLSVTTGGVRFAGFDSTTSTPAATTTINLQNANSGATGTATNPGQSWAFTVDTNGAAATTTTQAGTSPDSNGNDTQIANTTTIHLAANATQGQITAALQDAMKTAGFNTVLNANGDLDVTGNNLSTTGATATGATSQALNTSEAAIDTVQAAITKLGVMTNSLGAASNQITGLQNYSSLLSDALTTGVGALTDADLSEESAQLTSLQTKQQLAIQSLSMANSQSSSILSLFR